jgi:hypothetical protein
MPWGNPRKADLQPELNIPRALAIAVTCPKLAADTVPFGAGNCGWLTRLTRVRSLKRLSY